MFKEQVTDVTSNETISTPNQQIVKSSKVLTNDEAVKQNTTLSSEDVPENSEQLFAAKTKNPWINRPKVSEDVRPDLTTRDLHQMQIQTSS